MSNVKERIEELKAIIAKQKENDMMGLASYWKFHSTFQADFVSKLLESWVELREAAKSDCTCWYQEKILRVCFNCEALAKADKVFE